MWYQRDQFSNERIHIEDWQLINEQQDQRLHIHAHSIDTHKRPSTSDQKFRVGDIVYIRSDRSKLRARDRYIIVSILDSEWGLIRKFAGTQLHAHSYKIRLKECFMVHSLKVSVPHEDSEDSDGVRLDDNSLLEPYRDD